MLILSEILNADGAALLPSRFASDFSMIERPSQQRTQACPCGAAIDDRQLQAAIGMVSQRRAVHDRIRHSLTSMPEDVIFRFVVRESTCTATARSADDDTFVVPYDDNAIAGNNTVSLRAIGPLVSTAGWLACAYERWPHARFLGKADDDVFIDLPLLVQRLRRTPDDAVWGRIERFEWDARNETPIHFASTGDPCTSPAKEHFSFPFPKGPLFLLPRTHVPFALTNVSYHIARVEQLWGAQHEAQQEKAHQLLPYEDVFFAYLLFRGTTRNVTILDAGLQVGEGFWPGYSGLGNCTVAWHSKAMLSDERPQMQLGLTPSGLRAWKASHPCTQLHTFKPTVVRTETTCLGATATTLGFGAQHENSLIKSFVEYSVLRAPERGAAK